MLYILKDLNDPSKFKVENRSSEIGTLAEVSDSFNEDEHEFLIATEGPVDVWTVSLDTATQTTVEALRVKKANRQTALDNRDQDTQQDLSRVFNTRIGSDVLIKIAMWRSMLDNPGAFSSLGLKNPRTLRNADTSILFNKGAALNTNAKINAFATRKLEQASEHWALRAQRQQQYSNEVEAINNG